MGFGADDEPRALPWAGMNDALGVSHMSRLPLCEAIAVGNDGKTGGSAIPKGLCPPAQQPSPRGYPCQITPKPLNITANADTKTSGQTRTYGPGQRAFSPGAGELVNGDTVASVMLACPDGGPASALVGSYHIIASAAVGSGLGNYSISYHDGVLTVQPINPVTPVTTAIKNNGDGTVTVSFSGRPNVEYVVQASGDLFAPVWKNVSTNVAGADGRWTFEDSTARQRQRFYRSANP